MSRPESVSSRTATLRVEQLELGDLVALLLAAGEALVDRALRERRVQVRARSRAALTSLTQVRSFGASPSIAVLAVRRKFDDRDAGHLDGVLHGQEQPGPGPLVDASSPARRRRRGSRCRR